MSNYLITMVKKPDVTDLASEKVMIDFETGKYFVLVGSANEIWEQLEGCTKFSEIVENLLEIYEIDKETCEKEVLSFLEKLAEIGFIQLEKIN